MDVTTLPVLDLSFFALGVILGEGVHIPLTLVLGVTVDPFVSDRFVAEPPLPLDD